MKASWQQWSGRHVLFIQKILLQRRAITLGWLWLIFVRVSSALHNFYIDLDIGNSHRVFRTWSFFFRFRLRRIFLGGGKRYQVFLGHLSGDIKNHRNLWVMNLKLPWRSDERRSLIFHKHSPRSRLFSFWHDTQLRGWYEGFKCARDNLILSDKLYVKCKKCWNVYYESATQDKLGLSSISFRTCSFCFFLKGVHKKVRSTRSTNYLNIISLPVIRLIIHHDSNSCRQCILKSLVGIFSDNVQLFQANEKSLR